MKSFLSVILLISSKQRIIHSLQILYHNFTVQTIIINPKTPCKQRRYVIHKGLYLIMIIPISTYTPICFATSAAKSSSFFSIPSPVSKRTNFLILTLAPLALATSATYCATVCFPSSALT